MEISQKFAEENTFGQFFQNVATIVDVSGGYGISYNQGFLLIKCLFQDQIHHQTKNIFIFNGETKIYKQKIKIGGKNNGIFQWGPFYKNSSNYYGFYFQIDLGQFSVVYSNGSSADRKVINQENFNIDPMLSTKNKNGLVLDLANATNEFYIIFDFSNVTYGVIYNGKMIDIHRENLSNNTTFDYQFKYKNLPITQYCEGKTDSGDPALRDCLLYVGDGFVRNLDANSPQTFQELRYILKPMDARKTIASGANFVPIVVLRQKQNALNAYMRKFALEQIQVSTNAACSFQIRYWNDVTEAYLGLTGVDWKDNYYFVALPANLGATYQYDYSSTTITQEPAEAFQKDSQIIYQSIIPEAGLFDFPLPADQIENQPYPLNGYSQDNRNSYISVSIKQETGSNQTFLVLFTVREIY